MNKENWKTVGFIICGLIIMFGWIAAFATFWSWVVVALGAIFSSTHFATMLAIALKLTIATPVMIIGGWVGAQLFDA